MGRGALAGLPAASAVRDLCRYSDAAGLARLASHLCLLAAAGTVTAFAVGSWWVLPAMALQGAVQVSLFAAEHESVHRTAFRSRWLNALVAEAVGLVHVLPGHYFRRFHIAHHRFTHDPKRDPEQALAKPATLPAYLLYLSALPYWRSRLAELWRNARGATPDFVPEAERSLIAWEARAHLAVYFGLATAVAAGWTWPLWLWLFPAMLGQPALRAYLLAEHTGCVERPEMRLNTRTTYTSAVVRRLMWNMPFHVEHHAYPAVPFHALPALNARSADALAVTEPGYLAFHRRYLAALRSGRGAAFLAAEA